MGKKVISFRIENEVKKIIEERADFNNISISNYVRRILLNHLIKSGYVKLSKDKKSIKYKDSIIYIE